MTCMERKIKASFKLHIRCTNCLKEATRLLDVPDEDDAPGDIDELQESAYLASMTFSCRRCDGTIGKLFSISKARPIGLEGHVV